MKANSTKAIARKAQELAYGLTMAIKKDTLDGDSNFIPWITFHGMSVAIESFALILCARKSNERYYDDLAHIKHKMLDLRVAVDKDSSFFSPKQAQLIAELADHVFHKVANGLPVDREYFEVMTSWIIDADPQRIAV